MTSELYSVSFKGREILIIVVHMYMYLPTHYLYESSLNWVLNHVYFQSQTYHVFKSTHQEHYCYSTEDIESIKE